MREGPESQTDLNCRRDQASNSQAMGPRDHIRELVVPGSEDVLDTESQNVGGLDQSGFSSWTPPPCRSALGSQRIFFRYNQALWFVRFFCLTPQYDWHPTPRTSVAYCCDLQLAKNQAYSVRFLHSLPILCHQFYLLSYA